MPVSLIFRVGERILRVITFILILAVGVLGLTTNTLAKKSKKKENPKYASLVMDADTGVILSQRYADKIRHPASLTKIMTLLMVFEALDRGDIKKSSRIRMSRRAASMVPSKLGLPAGSTIKAEDAIYALVTKSANDVAVAVAEKIGGSESKFALMMTNRARTIGMNSTRFRNASGLHDKRQVTTARDMAKLGRYILKRYPHYYRYFSTKSFTYKGKTYRSHNRLMSTYKGMDGFKTGYINASGFNLVASVNRDGRRLIGVVFGGRSSKTRNSHMANILDSGFKKVRTIRVARIKNPPIPTSKPLYGVASAKPNPLQAQPRSPEAYASLSALTAKNKELKTAKNEITPNYTALTKALQEGQFSELIGEGDFDPSASKRIETGLIAIAVHKGDYKPNPEPASEIEKSLRQAGHKMVSRMGQNTNVNADMTDGVNNIPTLPHPKDIVGKWSVQIGAYNSRVATDEALREAKKTLPKSLSKANAMAVPLRTADGMVFRARLGNMSEKEAKKACKYFKDCMPVAPRTYSATSRMSAN